MTLLQAGVRQRQVASIGSPLPNAGEGLGVRGIPLCWINSRNSALDEGLRRLENSSCVLAPSPLTPIGARIAWMPKEVVPTGYVSRG